MLASPHLPIAARQQLLEYVQDKIAGVYGHSDRRRRKFAAHLPLKEIDDFGLEYDLPNENQVGNRRPVEQGYARAQQPCHQSPIHSLRS
jgi:hypothetical protein